MPRKNKEAVISAVFGCRLEDLGRTVIITPFLSLKSFKILMPGQPKSFFQPKWFHGFTGNFRGRKISVINCGLGAQRTADCVRFLALAGVKKILLAGAVGGLTDWLPGQILLAGSAARLLKESHHFQEEISRPLKLASPARPSAAWLKKARLIVPEVAGVFATPTLALWQDPARKKLSRRLSSQNITAWDLETAAFYETAAHLKIQALALHFVSDCPDRQHFWEDLTEADQQKVNQARDKIGALALRIVSI